MSSEFHVNDWRERRLTEALAHADAILKAVPPSQPDFDTREEGEIVFLAREVKRLRKLLTNDALAAPTETD